MAINYPVQTGGVLPATQVNPTVPAVTPLSNFNFNQFRTPAAPVYGDPNTIVQNSLEAMLDPNSSYIQNARRRGVEYAGVRGGLNSSIAAGAAERSAIEAAAPLAQQAVSIQQQRDQNLANEWQENQNFTRELQGQLAMMPVASSFSMLNAVQQYALSDPALYTPEVVSGYSNFFQNNMKNIMGSLFGS